MDQAGRNATQSRKKSRKTRGAKSHDGTKNHAEMPRSPYMSREECAEYMRMSLSMLNRYVKGRQIPFGTLPATSAGTGERSHIIFKRELIDAWLDKLIVMDEKTAYSELIREAA